MKKELDAALVRDFPKLYRDRNAPMTRTCMCWGFPGNGWEPLIREASEKIEAEINRLAAEGVPDDELPHATQVKEKFGDLRFYMSDETEAISEAIRIAEQKSAVTCECCGKPGKLNSGGWITCLCDECRSKKDIWGNDE